LERKKLSWIEQGYPRNPDGLFEFAKDHQEFFNKIWKEQFGMDVWPCRWYEKIIQKKDQPERIVLFQYVDVYRKSQDTWELGTNIMDDTQIRSTVRKSGGLLGSLPLSDKMKEAKAVSITVQRVARNEMIKMQADTFIAEKYGSFEDFMGKVLDNLTDIAASKSAKSFQAFDRIMAMLESNIDEDPKIKQAAERYIHDLQDVYEEARNRGLLGE